MRPQRDHPPGDRLRGRIVLCGERGRDSHVIFVRLMLVELEIALDGLDSHFRRDDALEQHLAPLIRHLVDQPRLLALDPVLELRARPLGMTLRVIPGYDPHWSRQMYRLIKPGRHLL